MRRIEEMASTHRTLAQSFDALIIDPDAQRSLCLVQELQPTRLVRCAEKTSGHEALSSFTRARFDIVITRQDLGDTDCWRWIRMVRSGRFGFAATPVFVLCSSIEHDALVPMLDSQTSLVVEEDPDSLRRALDRLRADDRRQSVLVIEDEPEAARAAERALEKYYRVDTAGTGEIGLACWRQHRHDLVLLDLRLPGISGEEVLRLLLTERPPPPVVVLTAYDAPERHEELMLAGAVDFVPKPVDLHLLPELCARTLRAQACLANADRALMHESAVTDLVGRVRAAQYHVERGQTHHAARHLRQAVFNSRSRALEDDDWARLLSEF